MDESVVTPWEVEGEIDYNKLIKQFGTDVLTEELLTTIKNTREIYIHSQGENYSFAQRPWMDFKKI